MPGLAGSSGIPLVEPGSAMIARDGRFGSATHFAGSASFPFQEI
jgi:hypothetical protein